MKNGVNKDMPTASFPLSSCKEDDGGQHETWDALLIRFEPIADIAVRTPEEMATIMYISGSRTGTPKGAMHDFQTMLVTSRSVARLRSTRFLNFVLAWYNSNPVMLVLVLLASTW
jgi:long-subunit acyl-CoA synthetase (AMP-forming)